MNKKATDPKTTTQILRVFSKHYVSALSDLFKLLTTYKTSNNPPLKYKTIATLAIVNSVAIFSLKVIGKLFSVLWLKYTRNANPPPLTEFLLALVLDRNEREYLLGDLEREFRKNLAQRGWWYAKGVYYRDAISYARPKIINWWVWLVKKLSKIGILAWLAEYIRRKIS